MKVSVVEPMWTLEQGVGLVCRLQQPAGRFNYHIAIGGGVVNAGWSFHDLDLYFLPMNASAGALRPDLLKWLSELWEPVQHNEHDYPEDLAYSKYRTADGRRIDVFVVD